MRKTCLACVLKHLGQAAVLMMEAELHYPSHKWLAVGHLAEASEECAEEYPQLAEEIREHRMIYMSGKGIPIMWLIEKVMKYVK